MVKSPMAPYRWPGLPARPPAGPCCPEVRERDELGARLVVDQHGVALTEGPPSGVLSGQAHRDPVEEEGADGQGLAEGPVHLALGQLLVALGELAHQLGVQGEVLGHRLGDGGQPRELLGRHARLDALDGHLGRLRRRRADGRRRGHRGAHLVEGRLEPVVEVVQGASASSNVRSPRRTSASV